MKVEVEGKTEKRGRSERDAFKEIKEIIYLKFCFKKYLTYFTVFLALDCCVYITGVE
jgi:hypothetical protein